MLNKGRAKKRIARKQVLPYAACLGASLALSFSIQAKADPGTGSGGATIITSGSSTNGLEVGQGNVIVIDFGSLCSSGGTSGTYNITGGALNNKGTIYLVSSNANITSGILNLGGNNVSNYSLISSANIPTSLLTSLNLTNLVTNFNFSFTQVNNFTNTVKGVISSAGSLSIAANNITNYGNINAANALNLTAANVINNSGILQSAQAASLAAAQMINTGTISSLNSNINAVTASLQNSNIIQALNGSVSIRNQLGNLSVNNTLGQILAKNQVLFEVLNGTSNSGSNLSLTGGLVKSELINFNAPNGDLVVKVHQLDGGVKAGAYNITLTTEHGDLNIVGIDAGTTGPVESPAIPTSPNSSTFIAENGDLNLGNLFFNGSTYLPDYTSKDNFVAIASRDIISTMGNSAVGSSINSNGYNIVLKAGWDNDNNKPSASGGSINLPNISFTTDGGNFEACAYRSGINYTGTIDLGNVSTTASSPGKSAGNLSMNAALSIAAGNISANGAAGAEKGGTGGNGAAINIVSQGGIVSLGNVTSWGGDGGKAAFLGNGGNGGNGGDIFISGSRGVFLKSAVSAGGNGAGAKFFISSGNLCLNCLGDMVITKGGDGGKGGSVTISSRAGGISFDGPIGSQGGNGGNGVVSGRGGDAGNVSLNARYDILNRTQTDIFAVGGLPGLDFFLGNNKGGNGGNVSLSSSSNIYLNSCTDISTNGYGVGQHAGNISLSARSMLRIYYANERELPWADGPHILEEPGTTNVEAAETTNLDIAGTIDADFAESSSMEIGGALVYLPGPPPERIMPPKYPGFPQGGNITVGNLDASGRFGASGGRVSSVSGNLKAGCGACNTPSIDVSSYSGLDRGVSLLKTSGSAGSVYISTNSSNRFIVGGPEKNNGTAGMILANGYNGGRIELRNRGGQLVEGCCGIYANGTGGSGGQILFAPDSTYKYPLIRYPYPYIIFGQPSSLNTIINGTVQATNDANDSGRIGFMAGSRGNLSITGSGSLNAGEFVSIGNLDYSTLELSSANAGKLSPYPPFALLVLHGEVKCNAGNCGSVAEVRTLGTSTGVDSVKLPPVPSVKFENVFTRLTNPNRLATDLPPTDLVNRSFSFNSSNDNSNSEKNHHHQHHGPHDGDSEPNNHMSYLPGAESEQSASRGQSESSEFLPIAKSESTYVHLDSAPSNVVKHIAAEKCVGRYLSGTTSVEMSGSGSLKLKNGDLLLTAIEDGCRIHAADSMIEMNKGAAVLVSVSNNLVKVRNVHERSLEDVKVHVSGHNTTLSAGQELVIGDSSARVKAAMMDDQLGRRKSSTVAKENFSMTKAEFSIASLIENTALLRQVYLSTDKTDKQVINKIMKMHACLNQVTTGHGIYKQIAKN